MINLQPGFQRKGTLLQQAVLSLFGGIGVQGLVIRVWEWGIGKKKDIY